MRDWSSDVCSSDLFGRVATVILVPVDGRDLLFEVVDRLGARRGVLFAREGQDVFEMLEVSGLQLGVPLIFLQVEIAEIGRASCRERVCRYVSISVVAVSLKIKL